MDPLKKKRMIAWTGGAVVAVVIAVVVFVVLPQSGAPSGGSAVNNPGSSASATPLAATVASPQTAYQAALVRAKQWHSDAAAVKVSLGDTSGEQWTFIFVSASAKNKGFQIGVNGQSISSTQEISYSGLGTALPANIISPDAVIAASHAIPGFGNISAVSLELLYNTAARQWYWGVKMANDTTVTIKATP